MNLELKNKRVLVTGSTSGIGEGIARRFAQNELQGPSRAAPGAGFSSHILTVLELGGVHDTPHEQDGAGLQVTDEEQERPKFSLMARRQYSGSR